MVSTLLSYSRTNHGRTIQRTLTYQKDKTRSHIVKEAKEPQFEEMFLTIRSLKDAEISFDPTNHGRPLLTSLLYI